VLFDFKISLSNEPVEGKVTELHDKQAWEFIRRMGVRERTMVLSPA